MRNGLAIASAALCLAALSGCLGDKVAGGTGVGNPTKGSVTLALVAGEPAANAPAKTSALPRNPDGSFDVPDTRGTVFTVRSGFANVGRIKLALPAGVDCGDADETACEAGEVKVQGPFVADLMTGAWHPDPGAIRIPVGAYKRMDIRLEARESATSVAPALTGHSLVFQGTFAYSGRTDRSFSIALDFDEDARFESDTGFTVKTGADTLSAVLDIAKWLSGTDLTSCLDSGELPLDSVGGFAWEKGQRCDGIGQTIKDAVKESGEIQGRHQSDD